MSQSFAWKRIAVGVGVAGVAILCYDIVGLERASVPANNPSPASHPSPANVTAPLTAETALVPAGTRIQIRLEEAISPDRNSAGDSIAASLYGPLWFDGKFLAPSRSNIIGQLTEVNTNRAMGHSKLTIVLRKLILNRQEYRLDTLPLTIETTADGNTGEAIGSAFGGGLGAGYTLPTNGPSVANSSQSRFTLTLSFPVELPVIRRLGGKRVGEWPNHLGFVSQEVERRRD